MESILILRGYIKNLSPLVIAKGKGESTDIELLTDKNDRFFIPGTSFKGALKHYFEDTFEDKSLIYLFFGAHSQESIAFFEDMHLMNEHITSVRDGIKLNEFMSVEKGAKFDYEILLPDREFEFSLSVKIDEKNLDNVRSVIKSIIQELSNANIKIGAFTSKGFGLLTLKSYKLYRFDFPEDTKKYFEYLQSLSFDNVKEDDLENVAPLKKKSDRVIFEGHFRIKNSLIIRKEDITEEADSVHITTNDKYTITGSSLKGALRARALRARALRIVNTLGISDKIVSEVFGANKDRKLEKEYRLKSRLIVNECYIEKKHVVSEMVHRIKIDRFTGGVMETALMSSKPIWHKDEILNIRLELEDAKDPYIGLILMVLKDLWNEDLALGGEKSIGRGVLKGSYIRIKTKDEEFEIKQDNDKLNIKGKDKLESFVKALKDYKEVP